MPCARIPSLSEGMRHRVIHLMFLFKSDDSILSATSAERKEAMETLIGATTFDKGYYLLLALSILIVTPGLLLDNASVVIGGMVMAPLLSPILLLALSIVTGSVRGMVHAGLVLLWSIGIILVLSFGFTWVATHTAQEIHWIPTQMEPSLYAFIAFCSGIAAALAWVKKEIASTIAGIAISVSLLPPLAAAGVGLVFLDFPLAITGSMLFGMNVLGIMLGSIGVFLLFGLLSQKHVEDNVLKQHD